MAMRTIRRRKGCDEETAAHEGRDVAPQDGQAEERGIGDEATVDRRSSAAFRRSQILREKGSA
ncbi:MAG: hypothetical protein CM15mP18_4870 [Methanobacteriota archaeon]|nr:MAG: hypothetical protein CM15mP18_4870 [Euryarchaeota archaeon]